MENVRSPCCQWKQLLWWLAAALTVGLVVGCASGALQQAGKSLLFLQPLGVGAMAAVVLIGVGGIFHREPPVWSAVVAGVATVVTQHVWLYNAAMAARRSTVNEQAAVELFKPGWSREGFFSYLGNTGALASGAPWGLAEWPNAIMWVIDGCLLVVAAVAIGYWVGRARRDSERKAVDE